MVSVVQQWYDERVKHFNANEVNDMLDAFIAEQKTDENSAKFFNHQAYIGNFLTLLIAGTGSPIFTLYYAYYILALDPEIQTKIQQEIDQYVGEQRFPSFEDDKGNLTFTTAFLAEIDRFCALNKFLPPRINSEEAHINGYNIPKGNIFLVNTANCLRDQKYFKNPDEFDPNNFLDVNGKLTNLESAIPFGIGIRRCPGEFFTKVEIFTCFTAIAQNFDISIAKDEKIGKREGYELVKAFPRFKVVLKRRNRFN
ncbi:cytochrome P450 2J2-like protein [Dinothrombium tinctorium]|uniref:Cytochrome P450 2J2-like protein n=1 Tax=Dinothrombium tinctorium TaxID=1965070 RepID=A0A3S3RGB1_9ACAR|nr:cytochrome P450 2J2-like protein [Dinothrombium tinctorium]RWR99701.1 cytochrome P450 2J2-like protein [Dinothrombium tinctorium]